MNEQKQSVPNRIDDLVREAQRAWPEWPLQEDAFRAWLADRWGTELPARRGSGDDLYLAFACSEGRDDAIRAFEARYFEDLNVVLRSMSLAVLRDEVKQLLRVKLFSGTTGAGPLISDYTGHGDLRAWFRVIAVRTAINLRRTTQREVPMPPEGDPTVVLSSSDPELAHLRHLYRDDFTAAFREAIAELRPEERNFLRLRYVDRFSIDRIGALYNIHRATAARRVERARNALVERTRATLGERLRLTGSELASLLRLLESTVDVDLADLLGTS